MVTSRRFKSDNRAVSAVIGFILILGLLTLTLAVYQAQVVPQQNAQAEFDHFEDSQNELIELRNAISTAGQADVSQFPSLKLGTAYQSRLLTINPPPPYGTLQTSDRYDIIVANETDEIEITTRFLEYQPEYNEIRVGSTRFEHSVLYLDERDRGNDVSIVEEQNIVRDETVRITALQNNFGQTGTERVTLELYPKDEANANEFPESENEDLTITIPTRLDGDEYWEESLPEDIYDDVNTDTEIYDSETYALNLSVDEDDLEVNTVGIQLEPNEGAGKNVASDRERGPDEELTGSFSGTVLDDEDNPVTEEVTFTDRDGNTLGTDTPDTDDGSYLIEDVEEGTYDIVASDGSRNDINTDVTINSDEETEDVDFELTEDVNLESIEIELDEETIVIGETTQATVTAVFNDGSTEDVTDDADLSSDDTDIATVEDDGTVTGESDGSTEINAGYEGETDSAEITVEQEGPTVTITDTGERPGDNTGVRFSWEAEAGSADLDIVEAELFDEDDDLVDSRTWEDDDLDDRDAGENNVDFDDNLTEDEEYRIVVTVTDESDLSDSDEAFQTAG